MKNPMVSSRRDVLRLGTGVMICASIGGNLVHCTPSEAAAANATFRFFSAPEGALLAEFAQALVPGAAAAGCAHFVDYHVGVTAAESLLSARYFDMAPPYGEFYRSGLRALAQLLGKTSGPARWESAIEALLHSSAPDWRGPPRGLFYAVVRSDAIDSVYCTVAGFERLGVPYLPHIPPAKDW